MDNLSVPIPSTAPHPAIVSPAESPNRRWLLWSAIGLTFLIFGIVVGIFSAKFLNQSPSPSPLTSTPTASPSPQSPTPFPTLDPTADWKIYQGETIYTTDGSTAFQIKYPAEWEIEKNTLYPLGRLEDKGLETRIILGTGGHGWEGKIETGEFPSGVAKYSWVNTGQQISAFASFEKDKQAYIIEIVNLPSARESEYKILFDQILSTFKFLD